MNEVRTCSIRDVSLGVYDGPHATPPPSDSGAIFLGIRNITEDGQLKLDSPRYISEDDLPKWTKRVTPRGGDIVFSYEATLNLYAIIPEGFHGCLGRRMGLIRPNPEEIDGKFLYYYFFSPQWRKLIAQKTVVGSTVNRIPIDSFPDFKLLLPSKSKQAEIAAVLSAIDEKLKHNNELIRMLEEQAQLVYDYWFMQYDFPDKNGKPYRSSGGKMEWNAKLKRELPEGWCVCPLSEHISSVNTGLNPRQNFTLGKGDIRYITVKNLTVDGSLNFDGCDTVDEEARAIIHARSDIQVGDILFASIAPLGRCYLIFDEPETWDINESVFSIRPRRTCMTPSYLYIYLRSDEFVQKATASSTGSIFLGIRHKALLEMRAVLPPMDVLESFEKRVEPLLKRRDSLMSENNDLAAQRDFLLPRLMSGQVTVAD